MSPDCSVTLLPGPHPTTTITQVQPVRAGAFVPPGSAADGAAFRTLPAFCRVAATLKPSTTPTSRSKSGCRRAGWNGKFQAVGNGAFNGTIAYAGDGAALARGYATSSTDTGHTGGGASLALGHPEKVIDFGWRAVHEMTVAAKQSSPPTTSRAEVLLLERLLGRRPAGHEGGAAFPAISTASSPARPASTGPAGPRRRCASNSALEIERAARLLAAAAPAAASCRARRLRRARRREGRPPREPRALHVRSRRFLQCKGADGTACLTTPQVDTARMIYAAAVNPKTGGDRRPRAGQRARMDRPRVDRLGSRDRTRSVPVHRVRGSELDHPAVQLRHRHRPRRRSGRRHDQRARSEPEAVHRSRRQADSVSRLERSADLAGQQHAVLHARAGGARRRSRRSTAYRLFMAPGMGHCGGGDGPNTFDMVSALEQWVERGRAPDQIIASHSTNGAVDSTGRSVPIPRSPCTWNGKHRRCGKLCMQGAVDMVGCRSNTLCSRQCQRERGAPLVMRRP